MNTAQREESPTDTRTVDTADTVRSTRSAIVTPMQLRICGQNVNVLRWLAHRLRAHRLLSIQRENDCAHDGTGHQCLPCCVAAQIR